MRYSAVLVDHFLNPRNAGLMRDADGVGEDEYEGCGDLTRFFLRVREERAAEVRFQTYGCGPTIAAASAASELCTGRPIEELVNLKGQDIEAAIPREQRHVGFVNLDQVMNHYAKGVFFGDQTDPAVLRNAGLSELEKSELVAFLKTLTDQTFLHDRRFVDPFYRNY